MRWLFAILKQRQAMLTVLLASFGHKEGRRPHGPCPAQTNRSLVVLSFQKIKIRWRDDSNIATWQVLWKASHAIIINRQFWLQSKWEPAYYPGKALWNVYRLLITNMLTCWNVASYSVDLFSENYQRKQLSSISKGPPYSTSICEGLLIMFFFCQVCSWS